MVTTYETENTSNTFSVPTDAIALDVLIRGGVGEDGEDTQGFYSDGSGGVEGYPNDGGTGGSAGEISGIIPVDGGETLTVDIGSNGVNGGQSPLGDAGAGGGGRGNGGNGGGASGITLQSSGQEIAVAAGGGGGGGGGSENTTLEGRVIQDGGGGGGGGSRGGSGGSGEKTVTDDPGSDVGEDGEDAQGTGNGGNGGRGSLFDGGDGSDGGTFVNQNFFSNSTEGTSRAGPIVQIAPIENPRGDTTTISGNTQQTYTVPDDTIAIDIEVRGGRGQDGNGGSRRSGPNAETRSIDGGDGGSGGLVIGRLPVSPGETFTVSGSDGSGNSPLGNGGSGSGDGGAPSGIVRDSDNEVIGLSDGGGGGGGAGSFIFATPSTLFENGGDGGGGGARGGIGGSGASADNSDGSDGTNASGSGKGGDGGDGSVGRTGGSGGDGGTTVTSELIEGKDGFVTSGTTTSNPGVDITPVFELPEPPSNLTATSDQLNQVQLTWTDNSANENQFNIYRALEGQTLSQIDSVGANVTSYTDTTADSGNTYTYAATYVSDTQESTFSNSATIDVYTPPPPNNVSAVSDGLDQINVSWADTADEDSYNIYRGGSQEVDSSTVYDTVGANTTSYSDTDIDPGDTYTYAISAVQSGVEGDLSQTASASVELPSPPTNFTATVTRTKNVELNWSDNTTEECIFIIYREEQGTTVSPYDIMPKNSTTYTDYNAEPGTGYIYKVSAVVQGVETNLSTGASATAGNWRPLNASLVDLKDVQVDGTDGQDIINFNTQ